MIPPARHRRVKRASLAGVFAIPFALLAVTVAGLVIGLTGSGSRDFVSWALLALPLLVLALAWARRG